MRLRRKKDLDKLLLSAGDAIVRREITEKNASVPLREYLNLTEIFGRKAPLWLDVGCGKGVFSVELAKRYGEVDIIAVERISNVLVEGALNASREKLTNIRFLCAGAEYLPRFFPSESADRIFLNFCTPYPKPSNENRRLTYRSFCKIYYDILKTGGRVELKTDDEDFFYYSLQSLEAEGFEIAERDENFVSADNIETEHEKMYRQAGKRIFRLLAAKKEVFV